MCVKQVDEKQPNFICVLLRTWSPSELKQLRSSRTYHTIRTLFNRYIWSIYLGIFSGCLCTYIYSYIYVCVCVSQRKQETNKFSLWMDHLNICRRMKNLPKVTKLHYLKMENGSCNFVRRSSFMRKIIRQIFR